MKFGLSRTIAFAIIIMAIIPAIIIARYWLYEQRVAIGEVTAKKLETFAATIMEIVDRTFLSALVMFKPLPLTPKRWCKCR